MSKKKLSKGKIVLIVLAALVVLFIIAAIASPTDTNATTTAAGATTSAESEKKESDTTKKAVSTKESIQNAIVDVVGEENLITFNYVPDNNFSLIKFKGSENLTSNLTIKGFYLDIFNILKSIQPIIDTDVDFNVVYPLQDQYGNSTDVIVIKATFTKNTIQKINFDNAYSTNIPIMADEWWNHRAVNISE